MSKLILITAVCAALVAAALSCACATGYTDISLQNTGDHSVRYSSGKVVYLESLMNGRWQGRYWSPDGRIGLPNDVWAEDAFQIEIDDQPVTDGWQFVSAREMEKTDRGARHFVVELLNPARSVKVKVHTLLDGTPVLARWIEITNTSDKPEALGACYPWAGRLWPIPTKGAIPQTWPPVFSLGSFTVDTWAREGWFKWKELSDGVTVVKCDKGQGHDDPFFIARNDSIGEYFIGSLAWSANWDFEFNRDKSGLVFKAGPAAVAAQRVIAPGETVASCALHLGHISGDMDTAVQAMHDHLRLSVIPTRKPERSYLTEYLVPADQGYYMPFDEASAFKCADVAAAIGSELFILDAYWWDITCDWVPSAKRFPNGLKPLVDYVHKKGMLFGLYVETEGGRGRIHESKIYKQHPEWFGPHDVIKMSIPEAAKWVESEDCRMIEEYNLDLLRLDYNPYHTMEGPTTDRNGIEENNFWRYYDAFYGMYERIHKKYPDLILQQCAAGGARNDLGTSSRFHEIYLTDGLCIPREFQVYSGQSLMLPPENFVILHGADGGESVGKPQNLDTVLRMTYSLSSPQVFVGTVAPSVDTLSPERKERFLHYAKIYKSFIRPLFPTCKMYHHDPVNSRGGVESSGWFASEYAAPNRAKGWATVVRLGPSDTDTYLFKPRGLDPAKTYEITLDAVDSTLTVNGLQLIRDGLPIRLESVGESELILFKAK